MHAAKLLHTLFDNACQPIDVRLRRILFSAAETLASCRQLSITSLGRSLHREAYVKHCIKCIDRLFGNTHLHEKRILFYQASARLLLRHNPRPLILVDWSRLTSDGTSHILRASVAVKGRSLTLYEQVYSLKEYTSKKTHDAFLKTLKNILPIDCKAIFITDAGFRNPWFRSVKRMRWDYVGRVRHSTQYRQIGQKIWLPIKSLYEQATDKSYSIGRVLLAKTSSIECYFYLMKEKKKGRVKRNVAGKKAQGSSNKKQAKSGNEPWLIASSLSNDKISAAEIMMIYKKRMQIEQEFRDLKNTRNGLGLRHCRSVQLERLNVALLIASLCLLVLHLIGIMAQKQKVHHSYQSNTEKHRPVLSVIVIGWQTLQRRKLSFNQQALAASLRSIASLASEEIALC